MNDADTDLLIVYLHGELSTEAASAVEARLRNEPALADELITLAREDVILSEWAHDVAANTAPKAAVTPASMPAVGRRQRSSRRRARRPVVRAARVPWGMLAAASVLIVAAIALLHGHGNKDEVVARLEHAERDAVIARAGREIAAADGEALFGDDELRSAAGTTLSVLYADGTRLDIGVRDEKASAKTTVVLQPHDRRGDGKAIFLKEGTLSADVAKQPVGRPLTIATPHAEATVLGTKLSVTVEKDSDRLDVTEGSVRFTKGTSQSVVVNGGEYAVASASAELRVQKIVVVAQRVPSGKLAPVNGCLWGASISLPVRGNHEEALNTFEANQGRKVAIAHQYHAFSDSGGDKEFPTAYEKNWAVGGRHLMLSWKPRLGNNQLKWSDVAAGKYDADYVDPTAKKLAAWGRTCFFTLHHQPDDDIGSAGSGMTPTDYVAMWRHVRERFDAAGAGKLVWVWTVVSGTEDTTKWDALYPGDAYVDWLACGAFNFDPAKWRTVTAATQTFRSWAQRTFPGGRAKSIMFNVIGCVENTAPTPSKESWFRGLPSELAAMPQVKAVIYWNNKAESPHSHAVDTSPGAQAGYRAAGTDPYFNPDH
jgi:hypothetical protein